MESAKKNHKIMGVQVSFTGGVCLKAAPARGGGARRDVAPRSPAPFCRPSGALPDWAAASRLKSGIFPDPHPPIQVILTQPLKSNCLSFTASPVP